MSAETPCGPGIGPGFEQPCSSEIVAKISTLEDKFSIRRRFSLWLRSMSLNHFDILFCILFVEISFR